MIDQNTKDKALAVKGGRDASDFGLIIRVLKKRIRDDYMQRFSFPF